MFLVKRKTESMLFWQNARPFCDVGFSQIKSPDSRLLEMDILTLATVFLAALAASVEGDVTTARSLDFIKKQQSAITRRPSIDLCSWHYIITVA